MGKSPEFPILVIEHLHAVFKMHRKSAPCRKGKRGPAVLASSDPADLEGGGADPYFEGGGSAPGPAAMAERETEVMAEGVVVGV